MLDGTRTWISVAPHLPTAGTDLPDNVRNLLKVERRFCFCRPPARQAYRVRAHGRALAAGGGSPSEVKHAAAVRIVARGCACVRIHARGSACRGAIRPAAMGLVLKSP